jgi:hypothetical protein
VTFTSTQVSRAVSGSLSFTLTITGSVCANSTFCPFVSSSLAMYGVTGSCTLDTTGPACVCTLNRPWASSTNENYVTDGGQLIVNSSQTKTYEYCVTNAGSMLAYREVPPAPDGGFYIPDLGLFSLTR